MKKISLKSLYVLAVKALRRLARAVGLLEYLEKKRDNRLALWVRSLFSIYDVNDMNHLDLPWWPFAVIGKVENFIAERQGEIRVFEFGAGASTLWLARRCETVISVEHDESFVRVLQPLLKELKNVTLHGIPPRSMTSPLIASARPGYQGYDFSDYVGSISREKELFDLIVVDGRARNDCLRASVEKLAPGGMLLFDNTDRERYSQALQEVPWRRQDFSGLTPALPLPSKSTVFIKPGN